MHAQLVWLYWGITVWALSFSRPLLSPTSPVNNVCTVAFLNPVTSARVLLTGFGVIFTDMDVAGTTPLRFFDHNDINRIAVAASSSPGGFCFFAVS